MKTIILSDLHLGHVCARLESAAQISGLIGGFDQVVLNGDSVEERCGGDAANRHLGELRNVAHRAGSRLVLLTGNHDPAVSDEHAIAFDGGRILVMHGDAVFPGISPWGRSAPDIAQRHLAAVREAEAQGPLTLRRRLEIAREISHEAPVQSWMTSPSHKGSLLTILRRVLVPRKAWGILKCWIEANRLTAAFCRKYAPEASVVIVGHTHRRGIWRGANSPTIVNLGGHLPGGGAFAVTLDDGHAEVRKVVVINGTPHITKEPAATFQHS